MFSSHFIFVLFFAVGGAFVFLSPVATAKQWGDFETIANRWAKKEGLRINRAVNWVDAFGRRDEMANYQQFQSEAEIVGDVHYGAPVADVVKPAWFFSHWYHNSMSLNMTSRFHKIKIIHDEFKWSVDATLKFAKDKIKRNFTFMIPPQLGLERKNYSKEFKADEILNGVHAEQSYVKYDKFNISQEITIPPKSSIKSTLTVTEREVTIPWSMEMEIRGYFAIWFATKYKEHWLYFYPVSKLAGESSHFKRVGDNLRYTLRGSFKGVFGVAAHLHLEQFALKGSKTLHFKHTSG